jgi:hypothetical protein
MWISKRLAIYLKAWRCVGGGKFVGYTRWSNRPMKGTSFYNGPSWTFNFWIGRTVVCLSRNCA